MAPSPQTVEGRLRVVEDQLEIRRVQTLYGHFSDRGWPGAGADVERVAALFVEDAVWEASGRARFEGREAIKLGLAASDIPFAAHLFTEPDITVVDDDAFGAWNAVVVIRTADDLSRWGASRYSVRYARTREGWRIVSVITSSIQWAKIEAL